MRGMMMILISEAFLFGISGCSAQNTPAVSSSNDPGFTDSSVTGADMTELANDNSAFAFDLYKALGDSDENIFFSPYSVSAALAMTYAGARENTKSEMTEVLKFTLPDNLLHPSFNLLDSSLSACADEDSTFSLHIVNALWGQTGYTFLPEFLEILSANYGAGIRLLDFPSDPEQCRETINDWVAEQTLSKIEDLIPPGILSAATKLVLTNAIYFNAEWLFQFQESLTYRQPFSLIDGEQIDVPMMNQTEHFEMARGDGYIAVELPYSNGRMSMLIILPELNRFSEIEGSLDNDFIDEITGSLTNANLHLSMPRFENVSAFQLEDILAKMGMPSAFGPSADFSGMDGTGSLYIASVIHKAFVSVDENGTEAAAATAVVMNRLGGVDPAVEFAVNHPFIYLIRDRDTGTILFMGRVMNPLE